jgi:ribosomal protein S6--L-glutamate ligase
VNIAGEIVKFIEESVEKKINKKKKKNEQTDPDRH